MVFTIKRNATIAFVAVHTLLFAAIAYWRDAMRRFLLVASATFLFVAPTLGDTLPKRDITPGVALTKVPAESVKCLSELMGESLSPDDPVTLTMICTQGYAR